MDQHKAICLAQQGSERGYQWLFEKHRMPLFRFIMRYHSDVTKEAADDILQHVFIRAFRSLASLRDIHRFESWILQIARRETLRHMAKHKRLEALDEEIERTVQTDERHAVVEEKEHLLRMVRKLVEYVTPEAIRETARRYYLGGPCTTDQLAKDLHVPHATVRKRLYLFREKLRDLILADFGDIP